MSEYHTPKKPNYEVLQYIDCNFDYDTIEGDLYRYFPTPNTWKICKCTDDKGYLFVSIQNKDYLVQNICWYLAHKRWPLSSLDHKDLNRANNKLNNLEEATFQQQVDNRTVTSVYGAGIQYRYNKFYVKYKDKHIGTYTTQKEALEARDKARNK